MSERVSVPLGAERVVVDRAVDGSIRVEVLDDAGRPLDGVVIPPSEPAAAQGDERHGLPRPPRTVSGRRGVTPRTRKLTPGRWTPANVGLLAGSAASSALFVLLVLHQVFGSPGWLADVVLWYAGTILLLWVTTREQQGRLAAVDRVATVVVTTGALLLVVPLGTLLVYVFAKGLPSLRPGFFVDDLSGVSPSDPPTVGGGLHAIVGTLEQAGLALLVVLPLGTLTAVFLNETRSALRRPVRIVVDAMSGLPSIVAGLFIYSALIIHPPLDVAVLNFNGFMASLALSMVMLPTVTRTVEVVLRLVPAGLREASLALGASRARTVWSVVLPTARSGVTTAVVLGLARIVGETAPLLFTSFGNSIVNWNPFAGPQESLPLFVYRLVKTPSENDSLRGYTGAVVLILVVLALFALARRLGRAPGGGGRRRLRRTARPSRTAARSAP